MAEVTAERAAAERANGGSAPDTRAAYGRSLRAAVPRSAHGDWEPAAGRADPVALLEEQARSRVPELVPIRYGRMLASPFAFYRGGAYIMAADLASAPRTDLEVQLCGDAHLSNFGVFAAPDRRLVFSVNDFDETLPGPFEWDVKRLAASFEVAGRERGFSAQQREAVDLTVGRSYRQAMHGFAAMSAVDVWYARLDVEEISRRVQVLATPKQLRRFEATLDKARGKTRLKAFAKLTRVVDGERRIVADPPLITPIEDLVPPEERERTQLLAEEFLRAYSATLAADHRRLIERFRYAHAARKVVGVGSVGTRAWIMLLLGRDDDEPLFLQSKEAQPSVLEPFLGASRFKHHGRRVVEGQRLMQSASDILLGWIRAPGVDGVQRDHYVRQLWDAKGSALVEVMNPAAMRFYAELCGWTLARAHARSGDPTAIAAYLGRGESFDRALAAFAARYADQNERDYAALQAAVTSERIVAETGL
jgi:uncharacterized protein (DUF2252 family)